MRTTSLAAGAGNVDVHWHWVVDFGPFVDDDRRTRGFAAIASGAQTSGEWSFLLLTVA